MDGEERKLSVFRLTGNLGNFALKISVDFTDCQGTYDQGMIKRYQNTELLSHDILSWLRIQSETFDIFQPRSIENHQL